jgi:hypothetical protein
MLHPLGYRARDGLHLPKDKESRSVALSETTVISSGDADDSGAVFTVVGPNANNPLLLSVSVEEGEITTYLSPDKIRELVDALEPFATPRSADYVQKPRRGRFH